MEEIDHEHTDEIVCPYCGEELSDSWEYAANGTETCYSCKKQFTYERIVTVAYSTEKK